MRWVALSMMVHAVVLWLLVREGGERVAPRDVVRRDMPTEPTEVRTEARRSEPMVVDVIAMAAGGGGAPAPRRAARARARGGDAWVGLAVRNDVPVASGSGAGNGRGAGNGIGFGNGGGVETARDVPPPPAPLVPPPSRARPAKLIWPTRDLDVEDESYLFVARITVDEDGDVVGARMVKTHPGSRGDHAANAIWTFRYLPALDARGVPTRTTFEQPFQVR